MSHFQTHSRKWLPVNVFQFRRRIATPGSDKRWCSSQSTVVAGGRTGKRSVGAGKRERTVRTILGRLSIVVDTVLRFQVSRCRH